MNQLTVLRKYQSKNEIRARERQVEKDEDGIVFDRDALIDRYNDYERVKERMLLPRRRLLSADTPEIS